MAFSQKTEDQEYIFIYDQPLNMISFTWKDKLILHQRFKEILNIFSDYVVYHNADLLFIDARENKHTMTEEIQKWHD